MSKYCRYCGTMLNDDALFCLRCGKSTGAEEASMQQQVQQPVPQQSMQQVQQQPFQQMQYQAQGYTVQPIKKSNKKLLIGIIAGSLAAVVVTFLVIFLLTYSDPKEAFITYAMKTSKDINGEIGGFGEHLTEVLIHLSNDYDTKTHTLTKETYIKSSDSAEAKEIVLEQKYAYDESGDACYEVGLSTDGESLGTAGVYFSGNEIIYNSFSTSKPMIRYEMSSNTSDKLSKVSAVDRFAYMISGRTEAVDYDWDKAQVDLENLLSDKKKDDFEKEEEEVEILGKRQKCDTYSIRLEGEEASEMLSTYTDMAFDSAGYDKYLDNINEKIEEFKADNDEMKLTMKVYAYKKEAVGVELKVEGDEKTVVIRLIDYKKDEEKNLEISYDDGTEENKIDYTETVINTGGKNYKCYTDFNTNKNHMTINEEGEINGNEKDLTGDFNITISGLKQERVITGTHSIEFDGKKGSYTTKFDMNGEKEIEVITDITYDSKSADINSPAFISESGIDAGTDLNKLKESFGKGYKEDMFSSNNSTLNEFGMLYLFIRAE
ncbi:hypothetical protein SAMN02910369_03045 [Lachnospiraceae bacterium NE2001]|nr:hypothetical protein SAMN02910369_03045 [Lachnospiraceae bacterium NE2001]